MKQLLWFVMFTAFAINLTAQNKPKIIAYYTGDVNTLVKYPIGKLDQIIYSFLHIKNDSLSFDNENSKQTLLALTALKKKHPSLKIIISMGGWTGCANCSASFSTAMGRETFAKTTLKILETYDADGIDLDWEYPAIEGPPGHHYEKADKENFTELIKILRQYFGPKYLLSFAAGGFTEYLENSIDWAAVSPLVDYINLMTYDLINGYSTATGHHTALYSRPEQKESTDHCVQWLLKHQVPAKKLIIGAAFYARVWANVANKNNGLYQKGTFKYGVDYKQFSNKLSPDSGWVYHWDTLAKAPYAYNNLSNEFATFDDAKSLTEKVKYVYQYKLGGIMFWELLNDPFEKGRLQSIINAIEQ